MIIEKVPNIKYDTIKRYEGKWGGKNPTYECDEYKFVVKYNGMRFVP